MMMMSGTNETVTLSRHNAVTTIRLNRLERRNAMNRAMLDSLHQALRSAADDPGTRVVRVIGSDEAFSTGMDTLEVRELRSSEDMTGFSRMIEAGERVIEQLAIRMPQPVIAVVDGPAAGNGLAMALACDYIVASNRATFGATQVRLGLHPDGGLTHLLPERVPPSVALDILWTGRIVDSQEALRIGLVDRVCHPQALDRDVGFLSDRLLEAPANLTASVKTAVRQQRAAALQSALAYERDAQMRAFRSPELLTRLDALRQRYAKTALGAYRV